MKVRSMLATLVAGAAALSVGTTGAQPMAREDIPAAFRQADQNQDGHLNVDEFVGNIVLLFRQRDTDADRFISLTEAGAVERGAFKNADRDGDGKLSLGEAVGAKMIQFFDIETSHDGVLSLDEVLAYEEKLSAAKQGRK